MTNGTTSELPSFYKTVWVPAQILTSLQIFAVTWVSFCFIAYLRRHRNISSTPTSGKHANVLLIVAVASYLATLIRFLTSQVAIISERVTLNSADADYFCETTLDAAEASFVLCSSLTYIFYFARQHALYTRPTMEQLNTKVVRVFRYSTIILVVCFNIVTAVVFLMPKSFKTSIIGCILSREDAHGTLPDILWPVVRVFLQLVLLSLFVYPLLLHYFKTENSTEIKPKVLKAIWQSSVSLFVCIVSDFITVILVLTVIPRPFPAALQNLLYDVSMMINVIAVIFCFENNRKVMMGSFKRVKTSKVKSQHVRRRSFSMSGKNAGDFGGKSFGTLETVL